MVVYEWTDSMDKTLDILRQNTVKLGELALENYNALKMRIHYLQLPLAILSAANAYAVMDLDHYLPDKYVSIACCVVSASLAGYLTYDWYVDSQKQMEEDFSFHKDSLNLAKQIKDVLAVPRYDRQIDGAAFLRDTFKKYKILISGHKLIAQYKGDVTVDKDSQLGEFIEDMEGFAIDNWNIIFRPTLRRFKKKNMELIENVKKGGQSIRDIVEPVLAVDPKGAVDLKKIDPKGAADLKKIDPKGAVDLKKIDPKGEVFADVFNWLNVRKPTTEDAVVSESAPVVSDIEDQRKVPEVTESAPEVTERIPEVSGSAPDVRVDFSEVYTISEIITSVFPKKTEEHRKNFSMNFMEKL
jgi:hypothetical protein